MVQQGRKEREDGALPAVLGRRGGEHGPHLAHECTFHPERSRLVDEGAHLCADVAEAGGSAEDDRVVVREFFGLRDCGGADRLRAANRTGTGCDDASAVGITPALRQSSGGCCIAVRCPAST